MLKFSLLELMKNIFQKILLKQFVSHDTNHSTKTTKRHKRTHCLGKNSINFGYNIYYMIMPEKEIPYIYSHNSDLTKFQNLSFKKNSTYILKNYLLIIHCRAWWEPGRQTGRPYITFKYDYSNIYETQLTEVVFAMD